MLITFLRYYWHRRRAATTGAEGGFTLIELLVTIFLASGIVSGLMYLAVEVLQLDQRESDRTETQRDMQAALTFIESELRQAVFVYDADCLNGVLEVPGDDESGCIEIAEWGLNLPGDMTPVLAFWRLQPFPSNVRAACAGGSTPEELRNIPCLAGSSYTLVVYSLGTRGGGGDELAALNGEAGIFRTEMSIDEADGSGYVSPFRGTTPNFERWPDNVTAGAPGPDYSEPALLVDYVNAGGGPVEETPECPAPANFYQLVPNGDPRSFYACVSDSDTPSAAAGNQDVILYLRGDAEGRSGIQGDDGFLPALESRVFIRGTLEKEPSLD